MKASLYIEGDFDDLLEAMRILRESRIAVTTKVAERPEPAGPPAVDAPTEEWVAYAESRGDPNASRRSRTDLIGRHG